MGNISNELQSDYSKLWAKINNRASTTGRPFELERDKYINRQNGLNNFVANKIPCIEVSKRLFKDSPILFVGMNPSGTNIKHYSDKNNNPDDVYIYDGDSKYYKAMTSFAFDCLKGYQKWGVNEEDAEDKYSVLDLFGIVQSTQKVIQDDFLENPKKYSGMFDIFLQYVKKVNPKVIIVANAFVRKVLKRDEDINLDNPKYNFFYKNSRGDMKFELKCNEKYGGYTFTIDPTGESARFQLFFSSMLSGKRALDIGSRENLVWLVNNYLSNNP